MSTRINVNVGVLGHVDSGKTSLCKAISTTGSTAAFDANPQSQERGITLDLGFSSFVLGDKWTVTLVDCPGHASLIRTVILGAQIMDVMLLIIDINKGMQPQTKECLFLAQVTSSHLIVILNKIDLIPEKNRAPKIEKAKTALRNALSFTKFGNEPIVAVSATDSSIGYQELITCLMEKVEGMTLVRDHNSPFLMAVDHCFSIRGQGTVITGTVLQGNVKVNDTVEFPTLQLSKKVKSMQSFKVPVQEASAGDRVGVCVPGLDPTLIERSVISAPGLVRLGVRAGILTVNKIPFFKRKIPSKKRFHISIGCDTITALITLFKTEDSIPTFQPDRIYSYVEEIAEELPEHSKNLETKVSGTYFALLEFDRPALLVPSSLVIASDLQTEDDVTCRLAFHGSLVDFTLDKNYTSTYLPSIQICRQKCKEGTVDRIVSENAVIAKGFCKKESKIDHIIGLQVQLNLTGIFSDRPEEPFFLKGCIESRFGQTNKVRIALKSPMSSGEMEFVKTSKNIKIQLKFKKFLFNRPSGNKLIQ